MSEDPDYSGVRADTEPPGNPEEPVGMETGEPPEDASKSNELTGDNDGLGDTHPHENSQDPAAKESLFKGDNQELINRLKAEWQARLAGNGQNQHKQTLSQVRDKGDSPNPDDDMEICEKIYKLTFNIEKQKKLMKEARLYKYGHLDDLKQDLSETKIACERFTEFTTRLHGHMQMVHQALQELQETIDFKLQDDELSDWMDGKVYDPMGKYTSC